MEPSKINHESGAVQSYLSILQNVINRMSSNSAGCKTWCITLVSAITVVIADNSDSSHVWVALVPIVLFLFLDAYYLGLEQRFRESYNSFIKKLHSEDAVVEDIYIINPGASIKLTLASTSKAIFSLSVWPFYSLLLIMLAIVHNYVL